MECRYEYRLVKTFSVVSVNFCLNIRIQIPESLQIKNKIKLEKKLENYQWSVEIFKVQFQANYNKKIR